MCIKNSAVDKSLPLQFLAARHHESGFTFNKSFAFGDNPSGNDRPLASCSPEMFFFSVASELEQTPEAFRELYVGHMEAGTAAVICELLRLSDFDKESMMKVADRVRQRNKL